MDAATIQLTDAQKTIVIRLRRNPDEKIRHQADGMYNYVEDFGLVNGYEVSVLWRMGLLCVVSDTWYVLTEFGKTIEL